MSQQDFSGERHKLFVNKLIVKLFEVDQIIYSNATDITKLIALESMIGVLDLDSQKKLSDTQKKINEYQNNTNLLTDRNEVKRIYKEISIFLHNGWLKELRFARPKYGKQKLVKRGKPDLSAISSRTGLSTSKVRSLLTSIKKKYEKAAR